MSSAQISILSLTQQTYAECIHDKLGKGRIHAGLVYEEFFRTGAATGADPAFNNAQALLQQIIALTDFTLPLELVTEKSDGKTGKILLRTYDQLEVETVLIPMQAGGTLCLSSQVGCRMGCAFCETGKMGLLRSLTAAEMISQVFVARHLLKFSARNCVFMGMGEPFDNYDAVMQACRILSDPKGLSFGSRHLTVSTSGLIEGIYKLIEEGEHGPNLAVSVSSGTDEARSKLMPVTKKHNLSQLYEAMRIYNEKTRRQILAAYVLLKGVNDSVEHACQLADYLKGLDVKVNLIPYNPMTRDRFAAPEDSVVNLFAQTLREKGYLTLLRGTKGQGIMAACGQLGNRQKVRNLLQGNR